MAPSETNLIAKFQKGDQRSETHIFNLYHRALFYFAASIIEDTEEARDIVAESFIKLWERRAHFSEMRSIKAFLYIATRNACFDFLKADKRKRASRKEMLYLADEAVPDEDIMHAEVKADITKLLLKEIEALPKQCRIIFKMIYFDELSTAEIATRLHLAKKTVLSQKARAVVLLKSALLKRKLMFLYGFVIVEYLN